MHETFQGAAQSAIKRSQNETRGCTSNIESFLNSIDSIAVGETLYLTSLEAPEKLLHIQLCWWKFLECISQQACRGLASVTKNSGHTALISCAPLFLLDIEFSNIWLKFGLTRFACLQELYMVSDYVLSLDRRLLSVRFNSSKDSLQEIRANEDLLLHDTHPFPPQLDVSIPAACQSNPSVTVPVLATSNPHPVTYELTLTKSEVTYLIGKAGARIQSTRESTDTTIKILPIANKLSSQALNRPESVVQAIMITGDLYTVALAMATIETQLSLHRTSPRKEL